MEVKKLSKRIGEETILTNINFTLATGEINGLIGRNGSGKTTLFRTLVDHYQLEEGSVMLNGQSIHSNRELYTDIFYLDEQDHPLATMNSVRIAKYYSQLYPNFDSEKYFNLIDKHKLLKRNIYRNFSKGMQGLFNVILAFSTGATYLFFDEPFDGLDIIIKKQVIRLVIDEVGQRQLSLLISSHNLLELEGIIDRALILKDGEIVKEYELEAMRAASVKLQLAFTTTAIPQLILETGKVLSHQGRVIIVIFDELSEETSLAIKGLEPVIFEELPITLEDLFASNLTTEKDFQYYE